jgi:murein DD-endopeptidase MepM/ murein hydrolase activator NlpD
MSAQPSSVPFAIGSSQTAVPKPIVVADNALRHEVKSGESLYSIGKLYGVASDAIVSANGMSSADKLYVGQMLVIPGRTVARVAQLPVKPVAKPTPVLSAPKPAAPAPAQIKVASADTQVSLPVSKPAGADGKFRWPLSGTLLVNFATSRSGINIAGHEGAAVRSVADGTVIYAGNAVQGYGNLVLIKHANGYVSAYAHLKNITVAKGDIVSRGEAIGGVGMTGSVSQPQLHFELREGATPVDPVPMLAG